ncbi:MAG: hypothetical protein ACREA4_00060 [Nitrososphaera sp.]
METTDRSINLVNSEVAEKPERRQFTVVAPPVPKSNRAMYRWLYATLCAAKGVAVPHR